MEHKNITIKINDTEYKTYSTPSYEKRNAKYTKNDNEISAIIPGTIVELLVKEGDTINVGDKLLIIEAMKMNNQILADKNGIVNKILVKKGDVVSKSQKLLELMINC